MLRLRGVCKRFAGGVDAVTDVDLDVQRGEFMFVLGPSGSGKTTLLRMIAGFGLPTAGHIELNGKPIDDVPPYRRDIGMVFQRYALFPHLTVHENVAFGLKMRGVRDKERPARVAQILDLVRLEGLDDRFPAQLSGGQQQRVALARALVYRPSLLLLDEPLANLDRRLRDEMRVELKRIQQEMGTTMLFVTHDQEEALTLGDRIAVMNNGRVEQLGNPEDVYRNPQTEFVASFIGDMNFLPGVAVEGGSVRLAIGGPSRRLATPCAPGSEVVAYVRPERIRLQSAHASGQCTGTVSYAGFTGDAWRYVVALGDDDTRLLSRAPTDDATPTYRVGDQVTVDWDESALCAFTR